MTGMRHVASYNSVNSDQLDTYINVAEKDTNSTSVEATYDTWAETYEEDSTDTLGFSSPYECSKAVAAVAKDGDAFLDIGAGTGLVAKILKETHGLTFGKRMGCDLSVKMLDLAMAKGLYDDSMKLDISVCPWNLPDSTYDIIACNGVLIYVENTACLDEFLRVTKPGGHICLMFRHDGYPIYEAKVEALKAAGKWELVSKSEDRRNFEKAVDESASARVLYNIYTFKKC